MTTIPHRLLAIALIAASVVWASQAHADIIATESGDSSDAGFTLASSGVIDATVSVNGTLETGWSQDVQLLNDNSLGLTQSNESVSGINALWEGANITLTFDTTTNKKGYDITGIRSYAGWNTSGGWPLQPRLSNRSDIREWLDRDSLGETRLGQHRSRILLD